MANNVIEVILRLTNQLSAPLRAAATQVRGFGTVAASSFAGAAKAVNGFGSAVVVANSRINHMNTLLRTAALIGVAKGLANAADAATLMNTRLKLVTDSTEELNQTQADLFKLAQQTRSGFADTVDLYARVARSSRQLGASQEDLLKFTTAVSQSIQVSGSTSREAAAGVIQFGQALASSRLSGDELRSVLEQMPRLAQAIADGLGVSIGKLREMGQAGDLVAPEVFRALLSQADKVAEEFTQVNKTISGVATTIGNSFVKLIGNVNQSTGAGSDLISTMEDLADTLADPETAESLAKFATALGHIGSVAVESAKKLGEWYALVGEGAQIIAEWLASTEHGADSPAARINEEMFELLKQRNQIVSAINSVDEDDPRLARWQARVTELEVRIARLNKQAHEFSRADLAALTPTSSGGRGGRETQLPPKFNRGAVSEALGASFFGSEKTADKIRENIRALQEFRTAFAGATDAMFKNAGTSREEFEEAGKALGRMRTELLRLSVADVLSDGNTAVAASTTEFEKQRLEIGENIQAITRYIAALNQLTPAQVAAFTDGKVVAGLEDAQRALERLRVEQTALKLGKEFDDARDAVKSFTGDIENQRDEIVRGTAALQDYLNRLLALSDAARNALVNEKIIDANEIERAARALENMRQQLSQLPVSSAAAGALEVFKSLRNEVQVVADEVADQQVALTRFLEELLEFPAANAEAINTVLAAQREVARQGEENIRRARLGVESLEAAAKRAAEIVQEAFGDAVRSIIELEKPRDILKNFLDALLEIPIQAAALGIGTKLREALKLDEVFANFMGAGKAGAPSGVAAAVLGGVVGGKGAAGAAVINAAQITAQAANATVTLPTAQVVGAVTVPTMTIQAANVVLNAASLIATIQQCISNCANCVGGGGDGGLAGSALGAAAGLFTGAAGGLSPGAFAPGVGGVGPYLPITAAKTMGVGMTLVDQSHTEIKVDSRADRNAVVQDITAVLAERDRRKDKYIRDQQDRGRRN